jgi:hypothetical protein
MPLDRPPPGVEVQGSHDGHHVRIRPYRHSLRISAPAVVGMGLLLALTVAASATNAEWATVVAFTAGSLGCLVGVITLGINAQVARERRRMGLEVRVGRDDLRLIDTVLGQPDAERRHFLRDLREVHVVDAARGPHLMATIGGEVVRIRMEGHSAEAAVWLAAELTQAARAARERDGAGPGEIPAELRELQR